MINKTDAFIQEIQKMPKIKVCFRSTSMQIQLTTTKLILVVKRKAWISVYEVPFLHSDINL